MNRDTKNFRGNLVSGVALLLTAAALMIPAALAQRGRGGRGDFPAPPRDWSRDLQMKITEPFTLASVGDLIIIRPASQFQDAGLQAALKIIRDSDVGFGNFESLIRDETNFTGPLGGSMVGTKEVAADLKLMGFKMVNRAGNHLFDSNQEGMFATLDLLDKAGVVYAGAGRDLDDARAPRFLETPKGRVGLVGMYSDVAGAAGGGARLSASYRVGNAGGRPGLNPLNLTQSIAVTPAELAAMKEIRDSVYSHRTEYSNPVGPPADASSELEMFGTRYVIGEKPGSLSYTMNSGDLSANLRSIKNGKEFSDFMIATIHSHQGETALQQFLFEDHTPEFLVALAHNAIDNGADAFVGHGPHIIRGIEIYKGKPIFYDLGEFFREWDWSCDCDNNPASPQTTAERTVAGLNNRGVMEPVNYESLIALSRFDKGKLLEVRIYPIWARQDAPISRRGIPELAPPAIAHRILAHLQNLSKPFGTVIAIDGNVGVIHVP
jgi:poly-gamma-glutamate synthesis protein (capsule biosynthesis protein)